MEILIACEYSGIVKTAFTSPGHNTFSVDVVPSSVPHNHIIGDAIEIIYSKKWDLIIAHPPCTYLCKAQLWRCNKSPDRMLKQRDAIAFFKKIYNSNCSQVAIENPIGVLTKAFRPPNQIIFPWYFGDIHSKEICLWLKGLPPLISTCYNTKRIPAANHVNSRMTQEEKSKIKSKFFPLVAQAMANQWL